MTKNLATQLLFAILDSINKFAQESTNKEFDDFKRFDYTNVNTIERDYIAIDSRKFSLFGETGETNAGEENTIIDRKITFKEYAPDVFAALR
jgi:hypothetical protein